MSVKWNYYNKESFKEVNSLYLPAQGEGENRATQAVVAVNKLVYKWYNDGDVYDNVNSGMEGWDNLSTYANWLHTYTDASETLEKVFNCNSNSDYEDILKEVADKILRETYLKQLAKQEKVSSVYSCPGPFQWSYSYDDEEEDW